MSHDLSQEFLRVVEEAAIASARTMGKGERALADHMAVESMRREMDLVPMNGTIVIGEGERDEAPMLYIGEKVGNVGETIPTCLKWILPSIRWRALTCAPPDRPALSPFWRVQKRAAFSTLQIATWRKLSSAHLLVEPWTWMRQ